ncbi:MAG: ATP-binding protein [Lachnoclostridium sp.]|nr:ATP-binding protein [Lachnoclostridium sp.]MCM1385196.1 ATP-binding protein [Lachnoclostridium sp.]
MEIKRDYYLGQMLKRKNNGLIKIVTGIRRCGKSYLLRTLFKNALLADGVPTDHIIEMAFDLFDNMEYRDPKVFYPWIKEQLKDDGKYYILLDEVQMLGEFVSVLNGLADKKNCDLYVSGSNAKFLSKDIATEFGGRGDEIHMYPLSFSEFMSVYDGNQYDGWNEYVSYGGIPLVVLADTEEQKVALLDNLLKETYIRDIIKRNKIRNVSEMEALLNILSSAIGSLTNPNKLKNTFKSVGHSRITATTITKYIEYLEDAFLVEAAKRYDIKGKAYIETPLKYYFMDMGLRNARINFRQMEVTHAMENVIYNELRMRGYHVDVGNLTIVESDKSAKAVKKQLEVDFICSRGSKKYYIQSAYLLETKEKAAQELRPLLKIRDSFKKIVITANTPRPFYNEDGILMMSVYDFLLNAESLEI